MSEGFHWLIFALHATAALVISVAVGRCSSQENEHARRPCCAWSASQPSSRDWVTAAAWLAALATPFNYFDVFDLDSTMTGLVRLCSHHQQERRLLVVRQNVWL